jgi:hypothetical protein
MENIPIYDIDPPPPVGTGETRGGFRWVPPNREAGFHAQFMIDGPAAYSQAT